GVFIILMGLFVAGCMNLDFLMQERRMQYQRKEVGYLGTLVVGLGFAAGWTACIGPIFVSILFLAASDQGHGMIYIIMYVIGFAITFLLLTFFLGSTRWIVQKSGAIMKIGGVIMIVMGIVLFTGQLPRITQFLLDLVE